MSQKTNMDDSIAISVEGVSKKYSKLLKKSMLYGITDISRNTVGLSSHSEKLRKGEFWAVDDVSFVLKKAESIGLIGPNGSGKTTMLKMLNGIFWPDKGRITTRGKVGALIEVGAGFHPLLTGRENIYVNGSILGMSKKEIDKRFDSIVDFAEIGDFLDAPVKHYSSGMYVRLGFAIAVHCEPEILLVDEILAVGDTAFKNKCKERILTLKNAGISTVLVSHNMELVKRLCDHVLVFSKGQVVFKGDPTLSSDAYLNAVTTQESSNSPDLLVPGGRWGNQDITITDVRVLDSDGCVKNQFYANDGMEVEIKYLTHKNVSDPTFGIEIHTTDGIQCYHHNSGKYGIRIQELTGQGQVRIKFPQNNLLPGMYHITVFVEDYETTCGYDWLYQVRTIKVLSGKENHARGIVNMRPVFEVNASENDAEQILEKERVV